MVLKHYRLCNRCCASLIAVSTYILLFGLNITIQMPSLPSSFLVRVNLTRVASPPKSTPRRFPSYLLLYFLLIFYLPRFTVLDFQSVSSLGSLPFLPCCHRTTTTALKISNFYKWHLITGSTFIYQNVITNLVMSLYFIDHSYM